VAVVTMEDAVTGPDAALAARAVAWRDADPDPDTRAELDRLLASGDAATLKERFEGSLAFGTAGIRAAMGAGPLRLNRLVAGRVAAGLARYMATAGAAGSQDMAAGVVIGYDGRAKSQLFATDAARILARAGIRVRLLPRALPTPVLAFAVRYLRTAYGLMVTASHNPRQDNGIKLYVRDGGQLLSPQDAAIAAAIDAVDPVDLPPGWHQGPVDFDPADDVASAYVAAVAAGSSPQPAERPALRVVHTALHGVGDATLRRVLAAAGWPDPIPVEAQRQPDPDFPTVPYPNPEAPGVLDLAKQLAEREQADLVLANDPDADRLAVMIPDQAGWRALTGDELGALLGDAVLRRSAVDRAAPFVVATTVVSGSLLRSIAQAAGARCVTTLTGFKWIARAAGPGVVLAYGYEQALGYAVRPGLVADKDGISAALLVLELAAELAGSGRTLADRLDDLALAHGVHVTAQRSLRTAGPAGLGRLADAVDQVRKDPPRQLVGQPVTVADLREASPGVIDLASGTAERAPGVPIPPANVLIWLVGDDGRVMIRPSGTEPELKIYAEAVRPARSRAGLASARASAIEHTERLLAAAAAALEPPGREDRSRGDQS
jgi:phosphomannomutase